MMKKSFDVRLLIILVAAILYTLSSSGQEFKKLDEAPHDITYYRASKVAKPLVKVLYGRPSHNQNTEIFGAKVPYNQLWITGANEATEIKLYKDVMFGNKLVAAGTYAIFTIPNKDQWEIILSNNTDVLDVDQYNSIFDVARVIVPVERAEKVPTFSIGFRKIATNKIAMMFGWGVTRAKIQLDFTGQKQYANI